jgi:hypothetical protein
MDARAMMIHQSARFGASPALAGLRVDNSIHDATQGLEVKRVRHPASGPRRSNPDSFLQANPDFSCYHEEPGAAFGPQPK